MKIFLFGCGKNGVKLLHDLKEYNEIDIVGITDTNSDKKSNVEFSGIFFNVSDINKITFDYCLVTSNLFYNEIKGFLVKEGVEENKIVTILELGKILNNEGLNKSYHYKCVMCKNEVFGWLTIGQDNIFLKNHKVIGMGLRKGMCPICGSRDKFRYVYYVLLKYTNFFHEESSVLHFAPEAQLEEIIRKEKKGKYLTADIMPGVGEVVADITKLQFKDNEFDWIICNHVMEHVKDEKEAFTEVYRCLKPNGILLLTVPISENGDTFEDDEIDSDEGRIIKYGQSDHVRLYGKDIKKRIISYGFEVTAYTNTAILTKEEINEQGFIEGDTVFICKKTNV